MNEEQNTEATFATVFDIAGDILHALPIRTAIMEQFKTRFAKDFPDGEALDVSLQAALDEVVKKLAGFADNVMYAMAEENRDEIEYQAARIEESQYSENRGRNPFGFERDVS